MRIHHVALSAVLASLLVCGCMNKKQPIAPPADEATLQVTREAYTQIDPAAKVGRVIAALADAPLVAVGDVNPAEFQRDEVVVFLDSAQKIIAVGHVVEKTADAVHVNYDVKADGRAPVVGDLAVKAKTE